MESLPLVDMTGKSPAVLEDGVAQDPKWKREVDAETGGCALGTKKSKDLLRCNRSEDKRQLILKNLELREKVTELRAAIVKANEEIPKVLKAHEVERSNWEDDNKKLDDDIADMTRLLNSVWIPKKGGKSPKQ